MNKRTRKTLQPRGMSGRFTRTAFSTSDIMRVIDLTSNACQTPPRQAYNGFGHLRNDIWYIDKTRAIHLIYEEIQGKRIEKVYRQCKTRNCINPRHYTHENTMNLTSYQATEIWKSLLQEPRVLEVPAMSHTEYQNNRNRLNKTRTKLMKDNVHMLELKKFEVSKFGQTMLRRPEDAFAILIRPIHVGSTTENEELAKILGITPDPDQNLSQTNQVITEAFNGTNAFNDMPFSYDKEDYDPPALPAQYAPRKPDEKKT